MEIKVCYSPGRVLVVCFYCSDKWLTSKVENVQPGFVVLLLNVTKILTKPRKLH